MSSIEVPDWVVARARAAVREFWGNYKGGCDCGEFDAAMKAAITAALGAWMVPVGRKQPHKEYLMHTRGHDDYAAGLFGDAGVKIAEKFTEQVYVLRQEKPE